MMTTVEIRLQAVRRRIEAAAAGRQITLVAVSKGQAVEAIRAAYRAGQVAFGESYVQEALAKQERLRDAGIEWHFVGPIQSNKTRAIAENFSWTHSVDRIKIAQRLSASRPRELAPLNVCLQVNVSAEATKGGVAPDELLQLALECAPLPGLKLRGLMAIPEPANGVTAQRSRFAELRGMLEALNAKGFNLDTLSMGMSDDLEAAIAEGATIVRVGTAIFGTRNPASQR